VPRIVKDDRDMGERLDIDGRHASGYLSRQARAGENVRKGQGGS